MAKERSRKIRKTARTGKKYSWSKIRDASPEPGIDWISKASFLLTPSLHPRPISSSTIPVLIIQSYLNHGASLSILFTSGSSHMFMPFIARASSPYDHASAYSLHPWDFDNKMYGTRNLKFCMYHSITWIKLCPELFHWIYTNCRKVVIVYSGSERYIFWFILRNYVYHLNTSVRAHLYHLKAKRYCASHKKCSCIKWTHW